MSRESRERWLRGLTIAVFVAAAVLAARMAFLALDGSDDDSRRLPTTEEAYSVIDALGLGGAEPVAVRGWVFSGPVRELRLCYGRDDSGEVPRCEGAFISLTGQVNEGSFDLRSVDTAEGPVMYGPRPVVVRGVVVGAELVADLVLEQ